MKRAITFLSLLLLSAHLLIAQTEVTATFTFDQGTEGQTADFGDQADSFLTSKVALGDNMSYYGTRTVGGMAMTGIQPKSDTTNTRGDGDFVEFTIQPKAGLVFTPTAVSLKAAKYGTGNGTLDIEWVGADGTVLQLETGVTPQRNNADPAYSTLTYTIDEAQGSEGACGLRVAIYGKLASNKEMCLRDIIIRGALTGEEVAVPMLGGFAFNGITYNADDIFKADGDRYTATIELSKNIAMVSATNPLTDITVLSGSVGNITYDGDDTQCAATIPVTLDDITLLYVATFVQKPDFRITYIDTDGTELGTQAVEKDAAIGSFTIDYATAKANKGQAVRGWFHKPSGGQKYDVDDIVSSDLSLYAVATDVEEPSNYKKYTFDLTDPYFYAEDHEAFTPEGSGVWHDNTHGWVFRDGDRIALLVGPKATISVGLCKYSNASAKLVLTDAAGNELATLEGTDENDGAVTAYNYEGETGTLLLKVSAGGAVYLHNVKIVNTTETDFAQNGNWIVVKAGDAGSLLDAIDYACGQNVTAGSDRKYIFLPNGTYDMGYTTLTTLSGYNISLIGQSTEGVVIKNKVEVADEGIATTATLLNTSQDLYMQDLTLQNCLDYYAANGTGRAVCFQDKGNHAIFKNVEMKSYQDTYYSQNTRQSYFETSNLHGTVDFICGGGDVRFQDCTLSLEPRNIDGSGSRTITAPATTGSFGYVFDGCTILDLSEGKGDWNFGRTWNYEPVCVYLNTTLDAHAAATIANSRWTEKGMNNTDPKVFGEAGTKDADGNDITPSGNIINSFGGTFETILTDEQAEAYSIEKMFHEGSEGWRPDDLTMQQTEQTVFYANGKLTWYPYDDGTIALVVFKNDTFVGILPSDLATEAKTSVGDEMPGGLTMEIEATEGDVITVRGANQMGGLGAPSVITVEERTAYTGVLHQTLVYRGNVLDTTLTDPYTIRVNTTDILDEVTITFPAFILAQYGYTVNETTITATVTYDHDEGESVTYHADNFKIGVSNGARTINFDGKLTGTQASSKATPLLILSISQGYTIDTAIFGDKSDVEAYLSTLDTAKEEALKTLDSFQPTGNGLFYYSQKSVDDIRKAITAATTLDELAAISTEPDKILPEEGKPYFVTNTTATGNVCIADGSVSLGVNAVVYFTAVEGGYALSNLNGEYVYKTTDNGWTFSTTNDINAAYVVSVNIVEDGYTLQGANGLFGTDQMAEGSTIYANKSANENGVWTISEGTEDPLALARLALQQAIKAAQAKVDTFVVGNEIFEYPESELQPYKEAIAEAQATLDDETSTEEILREALSELNASFEAHTPLANAPIETQPYILSLQTLDSNYHLNLQDGVVSISETHTLVYFKAEDGKYAIVDANGNYVAYKGGDKWSLTTSSEPYGWIISAVGNDTYTITGENGYLGTNLPDGNGAGSYCYGDKTATNGNYKWMINPWPPIGIERIADGEKDAIGQTLKNGTLFDLTGRRVSSITTEGIYVINGLPVLIRK